MTNKKISFISKIIIYKSIFILFETDLTMTWTAFKLITKTMKKHDIPFAVTIRIL